MFISIFMIFATISCRVVWCLNKTRDEYNLIDYTMLMSERHFAVGDSLVIMLPIVEHDSSNNEAFYLIKKLHGTFRWPAIVFNARYEMAATMFSEKHKLGSYIMLISGPCQHWEEHISRFRQQLSRLRLGNAMQSWNPRAKFLVSVMSNGSHFDITLTSRSILTEFWFRWNFESLCPLHEIK
jgi:hypothetical protein